MQTFAEDFYTFNITFSHSNVC